MKKSLFYALFSIAAGILLHIHARAEVKLPGIFSNNMVLQQTANVPVWGWAAAGREIKVKASWSNEIWSVTTGPEGEWKLKIATPPAGGPYTISISDGEEVTLRNVLIGDVWFCGGQSNMEMPMKGFRAQPILNSTEEILQSSIPDIRLITIGKTMTLTPRDTVRTTGWAEAAPETVAEFSAVGWFFGKLLNQQLGIPIGLINCNYGGSSVEAWMDEMSLRDFRETELPDDSSALNVKTPTVLYNGMLHPILGYGIKGVIWYQGEANRARPDQYAELFPEMVKLWRSQWEMGEFPFYYAQIAPFSYRNEKINSAYFRDVQRKAVEDIPNSGMAVLMDVGSPDGIHPMDKKPVGHRLAYLALHLTYGLKGFGYASPSFEKMVVKDHKAVLHFDHAPNGLTSYGQSLNDFEIAGRDKAFHKATAVIQGSTVVVTAPEVQDPAAVRYGFENFVRGTLFNTEGLPASSFRTDNW